MTTYYLEVKHSRFLSDADRSVLTIADDADLTTPIKGKIILATMLGLNLRDTQDAAYKLQWRNVTDSGSFADVGATGQVKYSASTACGKADGDAIEKTEMKCTNMDSTMTWANGLFNLADNLLPDSGTYATGADIYTEFHWAIDLSDSLDNKQYEFLVYNVTAGATAGTCAAQITITSVNAAATQSARGTESLAAVVQELTPDPLLVQVTQTAKCIDYIAPGFRDYIGVSDTATAAVMDVTAAEAGATDTAALTEDLAASISESVTLEVSPEQAAAVTEALESSITPTYLEASAEQAAALTEELAGEVAAQTVLEISSEESAALTEVLAGEISVLAAIEAQATQAAALTEELAGEVETQVTLEASATQMGAVTEALAGAVGEAAAETLLIQVSQAAHITEWFSPPFTETIGISDTVTVEVEALLGDVDVSTPVQAAAVTEVVGTTIVSTLWTDLFDTKFNLTASLIETSALTEVVATEVSSLAVDISESAAVTENLAAEITTTLQVMVADAVRTTEATAAEVIAQVALELAAVDSVAVVTTDLTAAIAAQVDLNIEVDQAGAVAEGLMAFITAAPAVGRGRFRRIPGRTCIAGGFVCIPGEIPVDGPDMEKI